MRHVRGAGAEDYPALARIFHLSVHGTARSLYSEAQCQAWSPEVPRSGAWAQRLAGLDVILAEVAEGPVGFMALDIGRGLLDLVFVHPDHTRQGHAAALYAVIEGRARQKRLQRLETEASRLAEPFFLSQGWRLVARQEVERKGVTIPNARMEKRLS